MAYVTQAMRRKMRDDAHEAAHPERARERIRYRLIAEQVTVELRARWPVLNAENFEEAAAFQVTRIGELLNSQGEGK